MGRELILELYDLVLVFKVEIKRIHHFRHC
jgi:hypothetical protein